MRIVHIGNHDQRNSNDDEGAITHALIALGHDVQRLNEKKGRMAGRLEPDLVLFHHWRDIAALSSLSCPKVFWYFDLVDWPDASIKGRCRERILWMRDVMPHVQIGFCTDGDWVNRDTSSKLVFLPQGADERLAGVSTSSRSTPCDILFTGNNLRCGVERASFVEEMSSTYGERFRHVVGGLHQRDLADAISSAKMVVAPDAPVTDRYCSNRVYLTLGFGGFLLHSACAYLADHYRDGEEIAFYRSRQHLHELIRYFDSEPEARERIAAAGLRRTLAEHTYRHRCEAMMRIVQERLSV